MLKLTKRFSQRILCALLVLLPAGLADMAAAAENWKMHIIWPAGRPEARYFQEFADKVNASSGGALTIDLYAGNSLNIADVDLLRILPSGAVIQIAGTYPGYLTREVPDFMYVLPAGVLTSPDQLQALLPDLRPIYEEVFNKAGVKLISFVGHGAPKTDIFCKTPVNSLSELATKKLRVWERFHVDLFGALGVSAQNIPQNELYVALTTGVIDCAVYPLAGATAVSLQEAAPYGAYLFPYAIHPLTVVVSDVAWNRLDPATQEVVLQVAREIEERTFADYITGVNDEIAAATLEADGATLLEDFSEADRQLFADTAMKLWQSMCEDAPESGKAICDTMQARVLALE